MKKLNTEFTPFSFPKGTKTEPVYFVNDPELVKDFTCVIDGKDYNRELKPAHVKEIRDTIMNSEFGGKYIVPIRVDLKSRLVVDGNHTLKAFREAWELGSTEFIKVMLIDLPDDEEKRRKIIIDINNTQKPWKIQDYTKNLANFGNTAVFNLLKFAEQHPLCMYHNKPSIRTAGCFLKGDNISKDIKNESIIVTTDEIENAEVMYKEVEQMMAILKYTRNNWFESFVKAWYDVKSDPVYMKTIKGFGGMPTFLAHLPELSADWQLNARKSYWQKAFRTALGITDQKVNDTHLWGMVN